MRIEMPSESEIDSNVRKQIETKLNNELKNGKLTAYETKYPNGCLNISTHPWFDEPNYIGIIYTDIGQVICGFTMDRNLNLSITVLAI